MSTKKQTVKTQHSRYNVSSYTRSISEAQQKQARAAKMLKARINKQNISCEEHTSTHDGTYYKAFRIDKPDNYSIGNTMDEALAFLNEAIKLRPDIYDASEI